MQKQHFGLPYALVTLVALAAPLKADVFVFNITTAPITGDYFPVGAGAFTGPDNASGFQNYGTIVDGIPGGEFQLAKNTFVPPIAGSPFPCDVVFPGNCRNIAESMQLADGTVYKLTGVFLSAYVGITDSGGDPIGEIEAVCGPDSNCVVDMIGTEGAILPLSSLPASWQEAFSSGHTVVADTNGSLQDAVDITFYDGTVASIEFMASVPEPAAVALLVAPIVILIWRCRKRRPATASRA